MQEPIGITYRQLLERCQTMSDEELNRPVQLWDGTGGSFMWATSFGDEILDPNDSNDTLMDEIEEMHKDCILLDYD